MEIWGGMEKETVEGKERKEIEREGEKGQGEGKP